MAVKVAGLFNSRDVVHMLENEVMAYKDLASLQGSCLPELIAFGRTSNGMACYLATSIIIGKRLDEADATSEAQLTCAIKVRVCMFQGRGYNLHGLIIYTIRGFASSGST